jgi:hypothetical protein
MIAAGCRHGYLAGQDILEERVRVLSSEGGPSSFSAELQRVLRNTPAHGSFFAR